MIAKKNLVPHCTALYWCTVLYCTLVRSWPRYPLWLGTLMFTWTDKDSKDTALVFRKRTQACLGMIKTPANGCCASYGLLAGHSASKARGHNSWIFMNTANCRYKQEEWFLPTQTWTLHGTASNEDSRSLRKDFKITEKASPLLLGGPSPGWKHLLALTTPSQYN